MTTAKSDAARTKHRMEALSARMIWRGPQTNKDTMAMAIAALSPLKAYTHFSPGRKMWGYWTDPEKCCKHAARHPEVKKMVWC